MINVQSDGQKDNMSYKGKLKSRLHEVAEGYDLYAGSYEKDHEYLNSFENDVIFKFLGDLKGKKVLDVGCGAGRLIGFLREHGAEIVAMDLSEEMLKITRKNFPEIESVKADIKKLPFDDGSFDVVIATFVIVHLDYLEAAFEEVYRVLKDGGVFIVTNINQRKPPKLKLKDGEKIVIKSSYHRPEDVIKNLKESFFEIEKEEFVYADGVWVNQVVKARK